MPGDADAPHDVYKCCICCSRMWSDEAGLWGHELAKLYRAKPDDLRSVGYDLTPRCFLIFNAAGQLAQQRGVSLFRGTLSECGDIFAEVLRRGSNEYVRIHVHVPPPGWGKNGVDYDE